MLMETLTKKLVICHDLHQDNPGSTWYSYACGSLHQCGGTMWQSNWSMLPLASMRSPELHVCGETLTFQTFQMLLWVICAFWGLHFSFLLCNVDLKLDTSSITYCIWLPALCWNKEQAFLPLLCFHSPSSVSLLNFMDPLKLDAAVLFVRKVSLQYSTCTILCCNGFWIWIQNPLMTATERKKKRKRSEMLFLRTNL